MVTRPELVAVQYFVFFGAVGLIVLVGLAVAVVCRCRHPLSRLRLEYGLDGRTTGQRCVGCGRRWSRRPLEVAELWSRIAP